MPNRGNPQNLNRYSYVNNRPINLTDPSGHFSPQEIEAYLRKTYGDNWSGYLSAWKSDTLFWDMLGFAGFEDVLFAPTTELGSGRFTNTGDGSFGFDSSHGLEEYQGFGPYRVTNSKGYAYEGWDVQQSLTAHPIDPKSARGSVWEQPLYRYTADGPSYTGYHRRVSYGPTGWPYMNLAASGTQPIVSGVLAGAVKQSIEYNFGPCQYCNIALSLPVALDAANDATIQDYDLQVSLVEFAIPAIQTSYYLGSNYCSMYWPAPVPPTDLLNR